MDEFYRKVAWQLERPPVYDQGVSEAAFNRIRLFVGQLEHIDPALLARRQHGDRDARRHLRMLAALIPGDVPGERLPQVVCDVVSNPNLTPTMVAEVLAGEGEPGVDGGETSGWTLRQIGTMLRDGQSQRQVADSLDVHRDVVAEVSTWLGVVEARNHALRDRAADHLEDGDGRPQTFAEQEGISVKKARTVLHEVAEALEAE